MYVILINDDNTMTTTKKQRILKKSKLADVLWFLANPTYNGRDYTSATVLLEYILPVSGSYETEILQLSEDRYNGYLKYLLPVDTKLTQEVGKIEIALTFLTVEFDEMGDPVQRVRKISSAEVEVFPSASWADIIPDSALNALDQRIIKTDAQIKALEEMNKMISLTKADNIKYYEDENELQLMSGDIEIGDRIGLKNINGDDVTFDGDIHEIVNNAVNKALDESLDEKVDEAVDEALDDGIPVVNFSADSSTSGKNETDNVVEF